jgi:hypothetical protein
MVETGDHGARRRGGRWKNGTRQVQERKRRMFDNLLGLTIFFLGWSILFDARGVLSNSVEILARGAGQKEEMIHNNSDFQTALARSRPT